MKLQIAPEIVAAYPDLRIGLIVLDDIGGGATSDVTSALLADAEKEARALVADAAAVQALPMVDAWREVYRGFGVNPNRSRPSSEALLRRVAKGDPLPRITALVDIYNAATLRWHLPIGGYDVDTLKGAVSLRKSSGGEPFVGIGAPAPEPTTNGEVVYADAERVLTRNWNYRDADATKITETSKNVVLMVEAPVASIDTARVEAVTAFIAEHAAAVLGARVRRDLVTAAAAAEWQS